MTSGILDEVKYELDWLLKMQDEKAGGVYHKVTCYEFPGFVHTDIYSTNEVDIYWNSPFVYLLSAEIAQNK